MRHLVTLFIACVLVFNYGHAHFVRGAWPVAHPWSGLSMVMLGAIIFFFPPPRDASPARRRLALLLMVAAAVCWLVDELLTKSLK